jgi:hypothetical protein
LTARERRCPFSRALTLWGAWRWCRLTRGSISIAVAAKLSGKTDNTMRLWAERYNGHVAPSYADCAKRELIRKQQLNSSRIGKIKINSLSDKGLLKNNQQKSKESKNARR